MNPIAEAQLLLLVALAIAVVAKRFDQPYSIALVLGGVAIGLIPGAPRPTVSPEVVFYLLLPPVLSEAAYFTSWRDFWRARRSITLLAIGLVTFTSAVVAALCVALIPGMTWPVGFALGAIVAPPDAAAATSILRGLKLPRRVVTLIEGESLVNDASSLTIFRFATAAAVTGVFDPGQAMVSFLWIAVGGTAVGLLVGWVFLKLFHKLKNPEIEVISTFLVSYSSYLLAEDVHASGVMASVASGLLLGWKSPEVFSATMRIRAVAVWQTVIFLINAVIFILIGLQLPMVLEGLGQYSTQDLLLWAAALSAAVIVVRIVWVFPGAYLPRMLSRTIRETEPRPSWKSVTVVGWTGLRGIVSLAAALSLPETIAGGAPFPHRHLILFLSFVVILVTLVVQGLSLRPLILALKIPSDNCSEQEQLRARVEAVERALGRLAELEEAPIAPPHVYERVRSYFENQLADYRAQLEQEEGTENPQAPDSFQTLAEQRL